MAKHFLIIANTWAFIYFYASFNLFIDKDLESIMTFSLLIYVSNVLDDFGIWLTSFWAIFVKKLRKFYVHVEDLLILFLIFQLYFS